MTIKDYRVSATIKAERVEKGGNVVTHLGPMYAGEGDYLVYQPDGSVTIWDKERFETHYSEVKGNDEFHPAGKTVDTVVEYMRENPDQVDRIIQEERDGSSRKGIVEYAK